MANKNCANKEQSIKYCTCTYESCPRKGVCCECIVYHKKSGELPGCFFTKETEATYDRTISNFILNKKRGY